MGDLVVIWRPLLDMAQDLSAAIRRFPARRQAIEERAARDEEFLSLCADLAAAEDALQRWEKRTDPRRDQRCAEYRILADELANEIEQALNSAQIIPLAGKRPKSSH
jgi:tRNA U34 5-methylaminomethyl-2-thiouridine-forming methyltransferase MnmC